MLFPDLAPRFRTTMMDPPWPERGAGKSVRGAQRHYQTLDKPGCRTVPEILSVVRACPLWRPYPDASHLWTWCTDNYLPAGLWLIEQLGFNFQRTFPWFKVDRDYPEGELLDEDDLVHGIGQYALGQHELLLFATRGEGMSELVYQPDRSVRSAIIAPHVFKDGCRVHSAKPRKSYERIEQRSKGLYAEIFARSHRPGWESWGNEIP